MCGIAGLLLRAADFGAHAPLESMVAALAHRGPDDGGLHVAAPVALGHRRLSIIDPNGGLQPLANEDGSVHVTFNGEIYNYRELKDRLAGLGHVFRTSADTEVLVHAWEQWGEDCVHQLRGMFAFAIWDADRRRLFLARDRVGIKPLLYSWQNNYLAFASEMQALTVIPGIRLTVNLSAIDRYLHYNYIPAPLTIYNEVYKLPPGHTLLLDGDNPQPVSPRRYWRLQFEPDHSLDETRWLERLDEALEETVRAHLISDVPFGAFLSGGIDSSTIVAYMSRICNEPVEAFCIGHADQAYDERNWAREAAKVTGANYHEELVRPDGLDLLPQLVRHYGEPFADSSAIATWYVSQIARRHVKMVLSGDGGDELFAGYHAYAAILAEHRKPLTAARRWKHRIANRARRAGLWPPIRSMADSKYARTGVMMHSQRAALWRPEYRGLVEETRGEFDKSFSAIASSHALNHLLAFDLDNYIPYDNLTKVDIASMCHGLEVRVPLLDHKFMELVARVPPVLKLKPAPGNGGGRLEFLQHPSQVTGKYLLKRNAERFFSRQFLDRPKRGFEVPVRSWFAGPHREELQSRLLSSESRLQDYFDAEAIAAIVRCSAENKLSAWAAWSLLVLDQWHEQAKDSRAASPAALAL